MDLKKLRAFHFVGKYGSLKMAANYLKLTSPAISLQIKKLERELRVQLFDRYPNKLVLTQTGTVLLKQTAAILEALSKLQESATKGSLGYSEKLTIALSSDLPKHFAPRIAAFSQSHPDLRLTVLSRYPREAVPLLTDGAIDAAVGWFAKVPPDIQKQSLFTSRMHLIFPPRHPLAHKKKLALADITNYRLVLHTGPTPTRKLVDAALSRHGIESENILEAGTCDTIMEFVELGLGIGFVHDTCLRRQSRKLQSVDMTSDVGTMEVSVIYRRSAAAKLLQRSLIDALLVRSHPTRARKLVRRTRHEEA
jgi:DNA-binding transcriptional LysR family regulator